MEKAVFLDRDGVINVDRGYVYKYSEISWFSESLELIKKAKALGYKVIVLTNQSGIARGMYTDNDVHVLHNEMDAYLKSEGAIVDDWFYCSEFDSELRKPRPGMLLLAQKKHNIDLSASFMVGDKPTDIFQIDLKELPETFLIKGNYSFDELNLESYQGKVHVCLDHRELLTAISEKL